MLKFENKTVVITGSGTGIGQAIAKKFAENGANIIILGRRKKPLEDTEIILKEIFLKINSNAFVKSFASTDVSDEISITNLFADLKKSNTNVDILINNAGVSGPVTCFANSPLEEFKKTIDIHLTGTFWTSVKAIENMTPDSKIITISTFFTEERPLEQRPYRFRSPYTAAQGAKNRLVECMSWELVNKKIISIGTNPGPVHSDRIYKTVYPKAASEFLRVSGFKELSPQEVENINQELLEVLGEDENTVNKKITEINTKFNTTKSNSDFENTIRELYQKIKTIAEKIQLNTSKMIADGQFLSQSQVAESIMNLCDDEISKILNGKIIPGDRVFYPVKPHITTDIQKIQQPYFNSNVFILTIDANDDPSYYKAEEIATHIEKNGGKVICFISKNITNELYGNLNNKFHVHQIDLSNTDEVDKWTNTAKSKFGKLYMFIHITGNTNDKDLIDMTRSEWNESINRFIVVPSIITKNALSHFVPNGAKDPREFKNKSGMVIIIGPDSIIGKKIPGSKRAKVEVFRGLLRPFATTVNQELNDVLKSKIRVQLMLSGSLDGKEPNIKRLLHAINYFANYIPKLSEVIYQLDDLRT